MTCWSVSMKHEIKERIIKGSQVLRKSKMQFATASSSLKEHYDFFDKTVQNNLPHFLTRLFTNPCDFMKIYENFLPPSKHNIPTTAYISIPTKDRSPTAKLSLPPTRIKFSGMETFVQGIFSAKF